MANHRKDVLAEAMYADYCAGLSIQDVSEFWGRTRQSIFKMFKRRGYELRPTYSRRLEEIEYAGLKYTVACTGYLRCTTGDRHLMHRKVYEDAYGPIPDGHDIHHLDHDKQNNALSNLVCLSKDEHTRLHQEEKRA